MTRFVKNTRENSLSFNAYRNSLKGLNSGSEKFMDNFKKGEHIHFNSKSVKISVWDDGTDFLGALKDFNTVHLFKNRRGLGMEYPEDLDWNTVTNYIRGKTFVKVINSKTQEHKKTWMTIDSLLAKFAQPDRTNPLNLLSLEFSGSGSVLDNQFVVPSYLRSSSMTAKLRMALEKKLESIEKELRKRTISKEKKNELEKKKKDIKTQFNTMPKYQKFFLLSMKGSFTDCHVDFSASSVYYHVIKGKKVFYVAEPTKENLEIYSKFETRQEGTVDKWIGDALFKDWSRIEINEGETAWMPSGYIHFVYTPEDSIVVGGNFLLEKYVERQFQLTKMEEDAVKKRLMNYGNMFQGFWNLMFSYLENVFIPEMNASVPTEEKLATAKIFEKYMDLENHEDRKIKPWYTREQKKKILEELKELLPEELEEPAPKKRKRHTTDNLPNEPSAKKKK